MPKKKSKRISPPTKKEEDLIGQILNGKIKVSNEKELMELGISQKEINKLKGLSLLRFDK